MEAVELSYRGRPVHGQYYLGRGNFTVGTSLRSNFRHEIGHHVHYTFDHPVTRTTESRSDWASWNIIFNSKDPSYWRSSVSRYAATNVKECFAECFSVYFHPNYGKAGAQLLPKRVHEYFERIFGG